MRRHLFLLAALAALSSALLAGPAPAMEVSEVAVDFPLAPVLSLPAAASTPAPAGTGARTGVAALSGAPATPRPGWEEAWFAYRKDQLRGNAKGAEEQLEKVAAFRVERGIPNLYLPSGVLLYEAAQALKQGRSDDALRLVDQARGLAPSDPAPHLLRAKAIWEGNRFHLLSSLEALLDGWALRLRDFRSLFPWILNLAAWVTTALLLASVIFILVLTLKVYPLVTHDLSHKTRNLAWPWLFIPPLLLVALLVTGSGFGWWLVILPLLLVAHLSPRERIALVCACFLLVCLPLLVQTLSLGETHFQGSRARALYEAERGGDGTGSLKSLLPFLEDPDDFRAHAAAALLHKRAGDLDRAEEELRKAAKTAPASAMVLNNLGNLSLARGDAEGAIRQYQAAQRGSDSGRIHFNLSQALRQNLQLEDGAREFAVAQARDPDTVNEFSAPVEGGKRLTADLLTGNREFLAESLKLDARGVSFRQALWNGLFPGLGFGASLLLFPAMALALLATWGLPRSLDTASRCPRCGRHFCPRCLRLNKEGFCAQCHQIFILRTGVDPANRVRKMMQIMNFHKRQGFFARVGTILMPGVGHVALGLPLAGFGFLVGSAAFWTAWGMWGGLFRSSTALGTGPAPGGRVLFFVFFGVFYFLALRHISRKLEEV